MKIVIAPNAFKESLSAVAAARAIAKGIKEANAGTRLIISPIADGGDGSVEVFNAFHKGRGSIHRLVVTGPLGKPVKAHYGFVRTPGSVAIIEMAKASGLALIPKEKRDPLNATSRGTGELIKDALEHGAKRIIICAGGSATADAGAGALTAMGVRFLDRYGRELSPGAASLSKLFKIDLTGLHPLIKKIELVVAADVDNPLCGPNGQARVYGPQKGATPSMVKILENAIANFAGIVRKTTGISLAGMPGAGAAGGLAGGLIGLAGGKLVQGAEYFAGLTGLDEKIKGCDLVITGEGRVDNQTLRGKGPAVVANLARKHKVPVICLAGEISPDILKKDNAFSAIFSIAPGPITPEESIKNAARYLNTSAFQTMKLIRGLVNFW